MNCFTISHREVINITATYEAPDQMTPDLFKFEPKMFRKFEKSAGILMVKSSGCRNWMQYFRNLWRFVTQTAAEKPLYTFCGIIWHAMQFMYNLHSFCLQLTELTSLGPASPRTNLFRPPNYRTSLLPSHFKFGNITILAVLIWFGVQ